MPTARITITLPPELVSEIDRRERNRSRFVVDAVRREVQRRRREDLRRSLERPHAESSELADAGLDEWGGRESESDAELLDSASGSAIRWIEGRGWVDTRK
jgi:hypothetical protein